MALFDKSFYLVTYVFFFLMLTSLSCYCNILFVVLVMLFSCEGKRQAQHSVMQNQCFHWPVACM